MKKLIIATLAILSTVFVNAQDSKVYKVLRSEWYLFDEDVKEWRLQTQNRDISIDLVVYKDVINIQAQSPTLYRLNETTKRKLDNGKIAGYRYSAIEYVNMEKCTVDIAASSDTDIFLFSVILDRDTYKVNLRYYGKYVE
jgi:hypothetical protein